ncbi:MAG: OmpH family outer membrane protein [Acidobacteria bacterium]|nr:OmpH family outer membrane protein [Acidobacteriota bacterium]
MRRILHTLALAALAAAALSVPAPAQEGGKVGLINSQEILDRSAEGKRALAQVQAADKKYGDDIAKMDEAIKQLQNRLSTQRLTLTPDAGAALQADIQKKQTDRQRAVEDAARSMRELQARTFERIQNDLIPLIEQVRKDRGLDLVYDVVKGGVVYFNPAIDLTDEIVKRYDALKAAPPVKK